MAFSKSQHCIPTTGQSETMAYLSPLTPPGLLCVFLNETNRSYFGPIRNIAEAGETWNCFSPGAPSIVGGTFLGTLETPKAHQAEDQ